MHVFRSHKTLKLPRGREASISIEAEASREGAGESKTLGETMERLQGLKRAGARAVDKGRRSLESRLPVTDSGVGGLRPENMIWIFGSGRSGSTWLRSMMTELDEHRLWEEPMVGRLFGDFYHRAQEGQLGSANFIMSNPTRKGWRRSIRNFTLDGARYSHPRLGPSDYLVIKEPNGSVGAPLLMEALPESRMILLLRDPRDVVASSLDAARQGSWLYEQKSGGAWKENSVADNDPDRFVRTRSQTYLRDAGAAARAYEQHKGPKSLVRYEELVAEPLSTMRRLYAELGISVEESELQQAVERHSWANIPEEKKGEGKFYRKGTSGGWKEDLTPKQVRLVERITAPLLEEFYAA